MARPRPSARHPPGPGRRPRRRGPARAESRGGGSGPTSSRGRGDRDPGAARPEPTGDTQWAVPAGALSPPGGRPGAPEGRRSPRPRHAVVVTVGQDGGGPPGETTVSGATAAGPVSPRDRRSHGRPVSRRTGRGRRHQRSARPSSADALEGDESLQVEGKGEVVPRFPVHA